MRNDSDLPGPVYLDASALLKVYLPEPDSEMVDERLQGREDLLLSDLSITEIISAAARRRREGSLTREGVQRLREAILEDLEEGTYRRLDLLPEVHRDAERLLLSLDSVSLRALDALHLSLAVTAEAGSIATFDQRLAKAAAAVGLRAWPI